MPELPITIVYQMSGDHVYCVNMQFYGLRVQCIQLDHGDFEYRSWDRGQADFSTAPDPMSLPTCILHAMEFFGLLPPGVVGVDLYRHCEWEF